MDETLPKSIRDDLIIFKNDTLKDIKQTEKTLLDKFKDVEFTIIQKIEGFDQQFLQFNKKMIEISSFIESLRDVTNNINSLTSFKTKSENTLIDLDIKLKSLDKDSHNSIFNIENILKSSVIYPGIFGTNAKFKTFHAFIDHILLYISQFRQFRDKITKEVNTNRTNAENSLDLLKIQLDSAIEKTQTLLNNEMTNRDEKIQSEFKLYDDKIRNLRMENAKSFEDVQDRIEHVRIKFNEKFDDINGKKDELFFKYNVLEGNCSQNTNDVKSLMEKNLKINKIINEINYKVENINKEIEDNINNNKKNKNNKLPSRMMSASQDFRKSRFKQHEGGLRNSFRNHVNMDQLRNNNDYKPNISKHNNTSQNNENNKITNGWGKSQSYKRFSLFNKNNMNMQYKTINTDSNISEINFFNKNNTLGNQKSNNDSKRTSFINLTDKSTYANLNSSNRFDKIKELKNLTLSLEGDGDDIISSLEQKNNNNNNNIYKNDNNNNINNINVLENTINKTVLKSKKKNSFISGFPRIITNQGERIIVCSHPVYHRDKFTNIINPNILSAYNNIQNIQRNKKGSNIKLNRNNNNQLNNIINESKELENNANIANKNKITNLNNNETSKENNFFKTSINPNNTVDKSKKEFKNNKAKNK